jgi:hypothetical protein
MAPGVVTPLPLRPHSAVRVAARGRHVGLNGPHPSFRESSYSGCSLAWRGAEIGANPRELDCARRILGLELDLAAVGLAP